MSEINKISELGSNITVTGSTEMKVIVTLEEMFGKVRIKWEIDSRYPIDQAIAQVSKSGTPDCINHLISSHNGYFDSEYSWGTGFYGSIWGWDGKNFPVTNTPVTK